MKKIVVLGLGKVGTLVAVLLSQRFKVTGIDIKRPHYDGEMPFKVKKGDVTDGNFLLKEFQKADAVVSALPFFLNIKVAEIAHQAGIHYFDLTEDVSTTEFIRNLSKTSKGVMAPQCGLAPGFIGIVGANLAHNFTKLRLSLIHISEPTRPY